MQEKINLLIKKSREVIVDCCLPNGAIVAANSDRIDYPHNVQNYRYVWPRDAAYILVAADILNIKDVHEKFFTWLMERAEDFKTSGTLFQNYYTNGPKRWVGFQPDQNGSLLWCIYEHIKDNTSRQDEYKDMVTKLADGICNYWNGQNFTIITQDLWEENFTFPEDKTNHTYSLAACSKGLQCATKIFPNERWLETSEQMRKIIEKSYDKYFCRIGGNIFDRIVDSSMLGLVYPFEIYEAKDEKIENTIKAMKEKSIKNLDVYRYENDRYDSFRKSGVDARRGAGFWPLLNFWMSIYYSMKNDRKNALNYYLNVVDKVDDYIPEQIFYNKIQRSVAPLAWSHAMFVIASKKLGFL